MLHHHWAADQLKNYPIYDLPPFDTPSSPSISIFIIYHLPLDTVMEQLNCSWAPHQSQHDPPPFVITPFDTPSPHSFSVLISYPPTPGYCTGTAQLLPIGQKRSCPLCFSISFEYACAYYCKFPQFLKTSPTFYIWLVLKEVMDK